MTPPATGSHHPSRRLGPFAPTMLFAAGLGGALGALGRYGMELGLPTASNSFPLSTFLVNVIGAALLGLLSAIPAARLHLQSRLRLFIGTGFCGGLTTFSSMSVEIAARWGIASGIAIVYVSASVVAAPLAIVCGRLLGDRLFPEAR